MTEALVSRWLKQPGDLVTEGEPLVEIETDKSSLELEAPCGGTVGPHLAAEGEVVEVGALIGSVDETVEIADFDDSTGPTNHDLTAAEPPAQPLATPTSSGVDTEPRVVSEKKATRVRLVISERVTESWRSIPHFTVSREIDAEFLLRQLKTERLEVPGLTLTDFMLRSLARALESPRGEPVNIGLAVSSAYGVMLPVITDVLSYSLSGIAEQRQRAVERARAGSLSPQDLEPPRSTLSNLGAFDVDQFTGIIAVGQTSLMTVGRIAPRVVAVDGSVAVRNTFTATVNADHREFDGTDAARILNLFALNCQQSTNTASGV